MLALEANQRDGDNPRAFASIGTVIDHSGNAQRPAGWPLLRTFLWNALFRIGHLGQGGKGQSRQQCSQKEFLHGTPDLFSGGGSSLLASAAHCAVRCNQPTQNDEAMSSKCRVSP